MFQAKHSAINAFLESSWVDSVKLALICSSLARTHTNLDPDLACLAGLIHQIGILPIVSYVEEHNLFDADGDAGNLQELVEFLHPQIGELLLKSWGFPEALHKVPSEQFNYFRKSQVVDYVDIVIVARLQCCSDKGNAMAYVDRARVPAYRKLGFYDSFGRPTELAASHIDTDSPVPESNPDTLAATSS